MGSSSSRVVKSGLGGKERREGGREGGRGREEGGREGGREVSLLTLTSWMDMIVSICMLMKQTVPCCPCKGHPVLS